MRRPWPHSAAITTRSRVWTGLILRHGAAPAAGVVGRVERLDHHALVAGADRAVEERRRLVGIGGDDRRQPGARPARSWSRRSRRTDERLVDDRRAAGVKDVEEVRRQAVAAAGRRIGAEVAHRVLEAARRPLVVDPERLAVEHEVAAGQARRRRGDRAEPVGDLVEVAGEQAHLAVAAMGLDPGAVELPLDRRRAGGGQRRRRGRRAGDASIGCTARPGTMPTAPSAASPPVSAAVAVAPRSPDIMWARRTAAIGTPAALATASTITPSSAPWRSSPPSTRHSSCCSGSVARANKLAEQRPARRVAHRCPTSPPVGRWPHRRR